MTDHAIVVEGLRKAFGTVQALDDLSLTVPAGRVCALLGPNGAGKSTAVRIMTTLVQPDAGTAVIAGRDVLANPAGVRRSIGLAGQYAAVDLQLTGRQNLLVIGRMHKLGRDRARQLAEALLYEHGLTHAADRLVATWSGGMRRRLDLVASFMMHPPVLFLDEPTTGLDPRSRARIWATVRERVDAGTTVLLTTQYLDEADQLADQVVIVDKGRQISAGTPDELKGRLGTRVEVQLSDASQGPLAADVLNGLGGRRVGPDAEPRQISAAMPSSPVVTLPDVVRSLDARGVHVDDVTLRRPSLDEVFLDLTGSRSEN